MGAPRLSTFSRAAHSAISRICLTYQFRLHVTLDLNWDRVMLGGDIMEMSHWLESREPLAVLSENRS